MTTPDIRAALEAAERHATAEVWADHPLAIILEALIKQTRAALAEPVGEGPTHEQLIRAYQAAYQPAWERGEYYSCHVDGLRAVLARWGRPAPPAPESGEVGETLAEALAARPLLEKVSRLGDCIGQLTVAQVQQLAEQASAWLRDNPPGQPVAIEPRGCPTPGACSCVEPTPPATAPAPVVVPVAVSERLPDPRPESEGGDCDAEGRCWVLMPRSATPFPNWTLLWRGHLQPYHSHWLPASAIPAPSNYIGLEQRAAFSVAGEA
jgi:hypothetical protein